MNQYISLQDVADSLGLAKVTVSLALRGSPKVARSTRERVRRRADELGYRPDPHIAALASRRWSPEAVPSDTIVLLRGKARKHRLYKTELQAEARARELGYLFQEMDVMAYETAEALERVCYARGIRGALLSDTADWPPTSELEFKHYPGIILAPRANQPRLHRVRYDLASAVRRTFRVLLADGYRRIGFFYPLGEAPYSPQDEAALGAYYFCTHCLVPRKHALRPLHDHTEWERWARSQKPDSVIAMNNAVVDRGIPFFRIGFDGPVSKERQKFAAWPGQVAMDQLDLLIKQNETGMPIIANTVLVESDHA